MSTLVWFALNGTKVWISKYQERMVGLDEGLGSIIIIVFVVINNKFLEAKSEYDPTHVLSMPSFLKIPFIGSVSNAAFI